MDILNALKSFFVGSAPIVAPLTTFALVFVWRWALSLQKALIDSHAKAAEDREAAALAFAKQIDAVQAEHVETAKDGLRIAGALEPLVQDVRDELVRRGRVLRQPKAPHP